MNLEDIRRLEAHLNTDPAADQRCLAAIRELLDIDDELDEFLRAREIGDLEDLGIEIDELTMLKAEVRKLLALNCMREGTVVTEEAADLMREIDAEFL